MWLVVFLLLLYSFYRRGLWDSGGNMRWRDYLESLWGHTVHKTMEIPSMTSPER